MKALSTIVGIKLASKNTPEDTSLIDEYLFQGRKYDTSHRVTLLMARLYQLTIVLIIMSWLRKTEPWGASHQPFERSSWGYIWALKAGLLSQTQKQDITRFLVSTFTKWVKSQEAVDGSSRSSQRSRNQQPPSHTTSPSNHGTNETSSLTLRLANDDAGDDGDGDADSPRDKKRKLNEHLPRSLFACPFFKRDPGRYQSERACVGPGWPTIHRMKYVVGHKIITP